MFINSNEKSCQPEQGFFTPDTDQPFQSSTSADFTPIFLMNELIRKSGSV